MLRKIFPKIFFVYFVLAVFLNLLVSQTALAREICEQATTIDGVPWGPETCTDDGTGPGPKLTNQLPGTAQQNLINKKKEVCNKKTPPMIYVGGKGDADGCSPNDPTGCAPWNGFSVTECLAYLLKWTLGLILQMLNSLLNFVLEFVSYVLDFAVYTTIVKFRTNFSELNLNVDIGSVAGINTPTVGIGGLLGVSQGNIIYILWGILRDLLNILILILVVYYSVKIMFEGYAEHKKSIFGLLIFSLIGNFSLVLVRFSIDISNILALQAYTLMVQPTGTSSFNEFRTRNGNSPAGLGEYILNSVDYSNILNKKNSDELAKKHIEDISSTFMFHLGKFFLLIGVIYLLLYITSMLFVRAVSFVYAMVLAAFLAADLFFEVFSSKGGEKIAEGVRELTNKMKNDFFDGLIKGPVMMFLVFLVGVIANGIFTQSLLGEIQKSTAGTGFSSLDTQFAANLYVFFKFAFFFVLCNQAFKSLTDLKIKGYGGGTWFSKYTGDIANFALRNTVGRSSAVVANVGSRVIGDKFANSSFGKLIERNTGVTGARVFKTLRDSSFDIRNSKKVQTLAKGVTGVLGVKNIDLGTGLVGNFAKQKEAKIAKAKEKKDEYEKLVNTVKEKKITDAAEAAFKDETKVDFAGGKFTKSQIDEAIKTYENDKGATTLQIGEVTLNQTQIKDLFETKGGKPSKAEYAQMDAEVKAAEAKKKKVKDAIEAEKLKRTIETARGTGEDADKARAELAKGNQENLKKDRLKAQKKAAIIDEQKELREQINILNSNLGNFSEDSPEYKLLIESKNNLVKSLGVLIERADKPDSLDGDNIFAEELIRNKKEAGIALQASIETELATVQRTVRDKEKELKNLSIGDVTSTALAQMTAERDNLSSRQADLLAKLADPTVSTRDKARINAELPELQRKLSGLDAAVTTGNENKKGSVAEIKDAEYGLNLANSELARLKAITEQAKRIKDSAEETRKVLSNQFKASPPKADAKPTEKPAVKTG